MHKEKEYVDGLIRPRTERRETELVLIGTDLGHIILELLPEIERKMRSDAGDYGYDNHKVLGSKGQFADIWRKVGKLKRALWEGVVLQREQPREILLDLIGHCLLTIAMIDRQQADDKEAKECRDMTPSET